MFLHSKKTRGSKDTKALSRDKCIIFIAQSAAISPTPRVLPWDYWLFLESAQKYELCADIRLEVRGETMQNHVTGYDPRICRRHYPRRDIIV